MAIGHKSLTIIMGTDALAGAHGQNAREIVYRVREAGQSAMDAIVAANALNAKALGLAPHRCACARDGGGPTDEIETRLHWHRPCTPDSCGLPLNSGGLGP
jgi:hypothetical protein